MFKAKTKDVSFLEGSIWDKLIFFALPLAATSILQQLFNSADMAVVGHFSGNGAFAAVGSTAVIVTLMIELFTGLSVGSNVIIARYIGSGNINRANDAMHTSVTLSVVVGIVLGVIGIIAAEPVLIIMKVPADILSDAVTYLRIYSAGLPFLVLYNFCASILRSRGNSTKPLYVLMFAGAVNVVLNVIFVAVLDMGVSGVAVATVISNAISAYFLIHYLMHKDILLKLDLYKLKLEKDIVIDFAKIGIPSSLLGSVFSISNICIQSSINSLGTDVISASAAASAVEIYVQFFGNAFAQAATTFISQNYGAKKYDRCKKIVRIALAESVLLTVILSIFIFTFGSTFLKIFTRSSVVIVLALSRMKYTLLFKFIQCVMDIMAGTLQGYGYTVVPAFVSVFGVCGIRLMWIFLVFPHYKTLDSIMFIYPVTQAIASIGHTLCYFKFKRKHFR